MFSKYLVVALFVGLVESQSDYCDPKTCPKDKQPHIACGNSGKFASSCPKDRTLMELKDADKQSILDGHNKLRNKIASGMQAGFSTAKRMSTMTWNQELADLAKLNVMQCKMMHDVCRSTAAYIWAGQNLGSGAISGGDFPALKDVIASNINGWYDEVKDAAQSDIDKFPMNSASGGVIGHFTQVVQDRAIQVGCAVARYTDGDWKTSLMACNYAFTNLVGTPVYVSGTPASGCTTGVNPNFTALCSDKEPIKAAA